MKTTFRRFLDAVLHRGPGYDITPLPHRGDTVDGWLRDQRDQVDTTGRHIIDNLLDRYRLHADTRTPLDEHVCEGHAVGDCDCFEQADGRSAS